MKNFLAAAVILLFIAPAISNAQQKLDRFESTIIEYENIDKAEGYKPEAVLFTGSSSIKMWKSLEEDMAPIHAINRGFGGSTIPEVVYYADRIILPHHPKIIVFYCGENDLANDESKAKLAFKNFKGFYKYMIEKLPETKVYFLAIKPSISREQYWPKMAKANKKIARYIKRKENFYYVDTATKMLDENGVVLQDIFIEDNLHMNAKGYKIWTDTIKPILKEVYTP